jgi:outer membrane protein assembly factor BamE (lipoprotein component of BamABCDE complex)
MVTGTRPLEHPQTCDERPARHRLGSVRALAAGTLLLAAALGGCVTQNADTGEYVPRGKQRYEFEKVEKAAEQLRDGMTKLQVLLLLGSPAEMDDAGNTWVYLPERYAILIPSHALQLEFKNDVLVSHENRAIVLGTKF